MNLPLDDEVPRDDSLLRALYYPFSRCMDSCALKQLLLVFDGITFLEPVEDGKWRAKLFRDLEETQDARFIKYREMEAAFDDLEHEGAITHLRPQDLKAFSRPETSASAISDLNDPVWREIARRPEKFGLPYGKDGLSGKATWQIFSEKLPLEFKRRLASDLLQEHLIEDAGKYAWTLSYEAGSAAALNLHLAAAEDLGLSPVTDSAMHHRLLLRKIMRCSTPETSWIEPTSVQTETAANNTAVQLIEALIPRSELQKISFDSILRFREKTRGDRMALVSELKNSLSSIAGASSPNEVAAKQQELSRSISKEVREYQASIAASRDRIWPNLIKASGNGLAAGTAAAVIFQYLAGGPLGVLAGSIGGAALTALQLSLETFGERRRIERQARPSVTYLSRVIDFK